MPLPCWETRHLQQGKGPVATYQAETRVCPEVPRTVRQRHRSSHEERSVHCWNCQNMRLMVGNTASYITHVLYIQDTNVPGFWC